MPMPRLPAAQRSTSETASAGHVNVKSAASAPAWNTIMATTVSQLTRPATCFFVGCVLIPLTV
jgi:hypothetical protein